MLPRLYYRYHRSRQSALRRGFALETGTSGSKAALIGGTAVATIIALVVLAVISALVGGVWTIINGLLTVIRPSILSVMGAVVGGFVGTYAARQVCDALLKTYSRPAIFVAFAIMSSLGVWFELGTLPLNADRIAPLAQLGAVMLASWSIFWRQDPV